MGWRKSWQAELHKPAQCSNIGTPRNVAVNFKAMTHRARCPSLLMSRTTEPRPASTTVIARDRALGMEVLMLRRSISASFMPGSYVFPGGAVDPADRSALAQALCEESPSQATSRLDLNEPAAAGALGHAVAALRECFEECGIWLGDDFSRDAEALVEARGQLLRGADIGSICSDFDLQLLTRSLAPWTRWVTPIDMPKRFDTIFFVAAFPLGQRAEVDNRETVNLVWINPAEALGLHTAGELPLEFATLRTLESLLPFDSASGLMDAARRRRRLEAIHPRAARTRSGCRLVLLPSDVGYLDAMRLDPEGTGTAELPDFDTPMQSPSGRLR